jgi:hypothetical protein
LVEGCWLFVKNIGKKLYICHVERA